MCDTNVFNRILDGAIALDSLRGPIFATHIQRDEIANTKDPARRAALMTVFETVLDASIPSSSFVLDVSRLDEACLNEHVLPTSSAVWGVSRWGQAKWTDGESIFAEMKAELDKLKRKSNNVQDALIAETSIRRSHVLVTDDPQLAVVTRQFGGTQLTVNEWLANEAAT